MVGLVAEAARCLATILLGPAFSLSPLTYCVSIGFAPLVATGLNSPLESI